MTEQYQAAIRKVWKEVLSTEEKLHLLEQLTRDEENWKIVLQQQYEQDVHNGAAYLPETKSVQILKQLHERIRLMDEAANGLEADTKVISLRPRILRWAAGIAAAVLIVAGFFWYPDNKTQIENGTLALYKPVREYQRFINTTDQQQQFRLSDGSEVKLAPGSGIVWVNGFTNEERKINLSGQAWFDVAKDSKRPFSVAAGNITTTALGTRFMVNPLRNSKIAVHLFEGSVKIESGDHTMKTVFLKPGQQCIIDAQLHAAISTMIADAAPEEINKNQLPAEKAAKLSRIKPLEFVQTPLVDVLTQLGNRYHVHFKYEVSEISNDQVTGTFLCTDSLNVALKLLRTINNLSFSQYQDTIHVSKLK